MQEIWKGIEGFEYYQVSNLGRVRSIDKKTPFLGGMRSFKGQILKPNTAGDYPDVKLSKGIPRKMHTRRIHRLVAESFIYPNYSKDGLVVNHIDGNKSNNNLHNLEVVTHRENIRHAKETGLNPNGAGTKSARAKFTADQVKAIRFDRTYSNKPFSYYAKIYGVTKEVISNFYRYKTYKDVI